MDPKIVQDFINSWQKFFPNEPLPITFELSPDSRDVQKARKTENWRCFVCDLTKIRNGSSLAFDSGSISCRGGQRYCGFEQEKPANYAYFLSYGIKGKVEGERYKKSPDLVDSWQDQV